jgi:uncharacterized membrane protein YkoI
MGWLTAGALVAASTLTASVAIAANSDDDQTLTGTALDRATAAALAETGGGTVIDSEQGDDGAAYSVEVQAPDGTVVEVTLDQQFTVTGSAPDDDSGEDHGGTDDD